MGQRQVGAATAPDTPAAALKHRTLVYCEDDATSVYAAAYGWYCLDCPATRDAATDPTPKANADRQAKRHSERERALTV